jgi:MinD-like ATPase involved in chromosome partitioning or flagellar assembly
MRSFGDVANAGRALVDEARTLADVVIIDTAPILATNDATELIPAVDAVVVVARVGKTSADAAKRTRTLLERLSAPAAGVVLIGTTSSDSSYSNYYTSTSPEPPSRRRRFRRKIRSREITDRIEPWRGAAPTVDRAAATSSQPSREALHLGQATEQRPHQGAPVGTAEGPSHPRDP